MIGSSQDPVWRTGYLEDWRARGKLPHFMSEAMLTWIDAQQDRMTELLTQWGAINSYSYHVPGLNRMADALATELTSLGHVERIELPPASSVNSKGELDHHPLGEALRVIVRPDAPRQVLLNIHYDTVYPPDGPFQNVTRLDEVTLGGPGVLDAKGGIIVLLTALRALEETWVAHNVGYDVLLTPDEEIGSPGSVELILSAARKCQFALLFEPALSDGSLVDARKGSGNFTFVVRGRAAHAGRDFHAGRSAIVAAARLIGRMTEPFGEYPNITVNCGKIEGGTTLNVVPDLAIARFNARVTNHEEQHAVEQRVAALRDEFSRLDGISLEVHGHFQSPPKIVDPPTRMLLDTALACARELGLNLTTQLSGGASDGNRIAAIGVPVLDSLGPVGADLHSERERVHLPSLVERAKLTALLLAKVAMRQDSRNVVARVADPGFELRAPEAFRAW
jgi:glutamate carboxypeptidase